MADVNLLVALDHTPHGERIQREGRMLIDTTFNTSRVLENLAVGMTNFETKMDPRKLQEGYMRLTRNLYDPVYGYERTRRMVEMLPERDKEQQFLSMKLRPDSLFMIVFSFLAFPKRFHLFKQIWKLFWEHKGTWRVYRFFQSVFWIGVTHQEYARRANRTQSWMNENPVTDPTQGRPVELPALADAKGRLPVVQ